MKNGIYITLFILLLTAGLAAAVDAPVPRFTYVVTTINDTTSNVSFTLTNTGGVESGTLWEFGDGETSTDTNPTHTYTTAAVYPVRLTLTNTNTTVSYNNTVPATAAFKNHSAHTWEVITPDMKPADFVRNTRTFYSNFIPDYVIVLFAVLFPFIIMWGRSFGVEIPLVIYAFTGGILAFILPSIIAPIAYWAWLLAMCGTIYKAAVNPD